MPHSPWSHCRRRWPQKQVRHTHTHTQCIHAGSSEFWQCGESLKRCVWFVFLSRSGQCLCVGVDHPALDHSCQPGRLLHAQSPVSTCVIELHEKYWALCSQSWLNNHLLQLLSSLAPFVSASGVSVWVRVRLGLCDYWSGIFPYTRDSLVFLKPYSLVNPGVSVLKRMLQHFFPLTVHLHWGTLEDEWNIGEFSPEFQK